MFQELYSYLQDGLGRVAAAHGERLLNVKHNPISLGKDFLLDLFEDRGMMDVTRQSKRYFSALLSPMTLNTYKQGFP